jgi:hypothetical protein
MNHLQPRPLPAGKVLSPVRVLRYFALSEEVAALLAPRLDELLRSIPRLRPWRGFNEGAWVIGARTRPDARRTTRADYSRVEFEIRVENVDDDDSTVQLSCRRTQRGRDERTEHLAVALDGAGRERLVAGLEDMLLAFAAGYFQQTA